MFTVYILYSRTLSKYYIGFTGDDFDERVRKHYTDHKGFTGKAGDWEIKHAETFPDKSSAMAREKQIKGWKSRKMIEKLIQQGAELSWFRHPDFQVGRVTASNPVVPPFFYLHKNRLNNLPL